jgi:hypothetical protein
VMVSENFCGDSGTITLAEILGKLHFRMFLVIVPRKAANKSNHNNLLGGAMGSVRSSIGTSYLLRGTPQWECVSGVDKRLWADRLLARFLGGQLSMESAGACDDYQAQSHKGAQSESHHISLRKR